jgi:integrase
MRNFLQRSRHGTVFYFRRRLPRSLVARLGRTHLVASLQTQVLKEAVTRARVVAVATDHFFTRLENMTTKRSPRLFRADYGISIELDPSFGRLKIDVTDAKPEDREAIDEHIRTATAAVAAIGAADGRVIKKGSTPTIAEASTQILGDTSLKPSTRKRYAGIFGHAQQHFGADTRLGDVTQEAFAAYADAVRANNDWSAKTKADYITAAKRLFGYYEGRNSAVPQLSAAGLKPKRTRPARDDRSEFTLDEYRIIFENAAQYRERRAHKWWATVACAFLGCRLEELAQAHIARDIRRDRDSGVWFLEVSERHEVGTPASPKSVKSLAAWRKVPLHSALIEAGFTDYLQREADAGAVTPFGRYWSPLHDKKTGGVKHSHKITQWGGRELDKLQAKGLITRTGLTYFHSLRHGFNTLLAGANVGEEWRSALLGQAFGGVNSQVYNKAGNDPTLTSPLVERGLIKLAEILREVRAKNEDACEYE